MITSPRPRPFAIITGASSGIGYQLARCCAEQGYDLLLAADTPEIEDAAQALRELGGRVDGVLCDPCSVRGTGQIHRIAAGRTIDALLVNACMGRSHVLADEPPDARTLVDAHITGTLYLLHMLGGAMRGDGRGRILVTGTLRGFVPAFMDSFSLGLRSRLKQGGAKVICVIPGAAQPGEFSRTDGAGTQVIYCTHDDPTAVAMAGFEALQQGLETEDDGVAPDAADSTLGDLSQPVVRTAALPGVPVALLAKSLRLGGVAR